MNSRPSRGARLLCLTTLAFSVLCAGALATELSGLYDVPAFFL